MRKYFIAQVEETDHANSTPFALRRINLATAVESATKKHKKHKEIESRPLGLAVKQFPRRVCLQRFVASALAFSFVPLVPFRGNSTAGFRINHVTQRGNLRWQAKRDTAFGRRSVLELPPAILRSKAPSSLRFAGAVQNLAEGRSAGGTPGYVTPGTTNPVVPATEPKKFYRRFKP